MNEQMNEISTKLTATLREYLLQSNCPSKDVQILVRELDGLKKIKEEPKQADTLAA